MLLRYAAPPTALYTSRILRGPDSDSPRPQATLPEPSSQPPSLPPYSRPLVQAAQGSAIGLTQAMVLYPLERFATRRYINCLPCGNDIPAHPFRLFRGISASLTTRVLKVGFSFMGLDHVKSTLDTHFPISCASTAALSGAVIGCLEALIFNPVTVIKNRLQADSGPATLLGQFREFKKSEWFLGTLPTVQRNVICNTISCFVLGTVYGTFPSDKTSPSTVQTMIIGGAAFFIGSLASLPFEAKRLDVVLNQTQRHPFYQITLRLAPGLAKVTLMGMIAGPGLYPIFRSQAVE